MDNNNNMLFLTKYRPQYLKDFEMDDQMIEVLLTLIKIDRLNILFMGDIGSGKTTFLNAVIREYYQGYTPQEYQDNILHINSLKEQGIHYYRNDVKTFCQTCSVIKRKKKIIVLDDLDIINEQSQQVFRNYLDKYSHNVHFLSSCSNAQKVIESLQSRFLLVKINALQKPQLHNILRRIAKAEDIHLSPEAQEFVMDVSNNNAKILINYMEKFKLLNVHEVDLPLATNVCTNIRFTCFEQYTQLLQQHNLPSAIQLMYEIYDKGYSVMDILDNYFLFVKITRLLTETQKYAIIPILCKYITVFHNIHEDEIELALLSNNLFELFLG